MVVETEIIPFFEWLQLAVPFFLTVAVAVAVFALAASYLICAVRYGPLAGGDVVYRVVTTSIKEILQISPRRVFALAWLAIQESVRRRVLVVFAVFLAILLFAGWFLDNSSHDAGKLYLSFVLTATTYLVLLLALFLSVFSIPNDVKSRTIYTIVTKPVRPGEIVLGRVIGFSLVGTVVLLVMGISSYIFVFRSVNHTHEVVLLDDPELVEELPEGERFRTTTEQEHRHVIFEDADGNLATDFRNSHWHPISAEDSPEGTTYSVSPPEGTFTARVPIYGKLSFLDRAGRPASKGVNTGSEWMYRSFIEGGSAAAAIWRFPGITRERFPPEEFPDGIPFEMTLRVFRTYKGDVERGIPGSYVIRNPDKPDIQSSEQIFVAREFYTDRKFIPFELEDEKGNKLDLFEDLVSDGKLELAVKCLDPAQYFGMAQADVYLKADDAPFAMNFVKGYLSIWTQMVLVTGFGVMFSTFLNGAVAMIATLAAIIMGFFTKFVTDVATETVSGGGPIEALIRLLTQKNLVSPLEDTLGNRVAQLLDEGVMFVMVRMGYILPNFRQFDSSDYVANGYNIPWDLALQNLVATFGYLAAVFVAGFFFMKTREVAK